jgi:hypothetical protein
MKQIVFVVFFLLILLTGMSSFAQGVSVDPDGKVSEQTFSLPYAFVNESFGLAAAYAYGVVGRPQKQAMLLATAMSGSKGSAMDFLIGRVAPEWNLYTLHTDMKWCLGLGFRAWAKDLVARIDTAVSDEDFKVQMMVSQPFQF